MSVSRQPLRRPARKYTTHDVHVDAAIASLLKSFPDEQDRQLLTEMVSTVYRLGVDQATTGDLKLLNSALKELRYAFKIFRPYRHIRKVATFGSARVGHDHPAYAIASEFGRQMASAQWMVITGAASGVMRAGHEGAGAAASFGLNIRLPFEQDANEVIADDAKLVNCKYFFTRKLLFLKESHATALFPGGFGTLDEGFESLTLVQTGKSEPRPIVFVDAPGGAFWRPMLRFFEEQLVRGGMISPADQAIYHVAESAQDAARHILDFYATYHSMRYFNDRLVLRLQRPLSIGAPGALSREFRDILTGDILAGKALPEEVDEPELAKLPRLVVPFNRSQFGRLAQLIHRVNELGRSPAAA